MTQSTKSAGSFFDLTGTIGNMLDTLGRSFLLVGYFPALLFVLVHQLILFPAWLGYPINIFSTTNAVSQSATFTEQVAALDLQIWETLSTNLTTFFLPVFLGLLLLSLNSAIIYLYEGRIKFLQKTILRFSYQRNLKQCRELYSEIIELRKKYREILVELGQTTNMQPKNLTAQQKADAVAKAIENAFDKVEQKNLQQLLPMREYRVTPTALGNTLAIAEEYPFDRYGIDAVLLWPRLRPLLDEAAPDQAQRLTNQKTVLDLVLNLSLLSGILVVEFAFTLVFAYLYQPAIVIVLWLALVISLLLFWVFYIAGVSAARTLGYFVTTSFDYYRHLVLDQFGLVQPKNILAEQIMWLKLSVFLKRGEHFYWPDAPQNDTAAHEATSNQTGDGSAHREKERDK